MTAKKGTARKTGKAGSKKAAPRKTSAARRPAAKKTVRTAARKAAPKTKVASAKRSARTAPKKSALKAKKPTVPKKSALKTKKPTARKSSPGKKKAVSTAKGKLTVAQTRVFRDMLMELRERVEKEIEFLSGEHVSHSLREQSGDLSMYSFHMADQGTDNFDRDFALNLVSSGQDTLYEIDSALERLERGVYGLCEACGERIEKARLEALPFAEMCIRCKSEKEKGKKHFREFGEPFKG